MNKLVKLTVTRGRDEVIIFSRLLPTESFFFATNRTRFRITCGRLPKRITAKST
jgi:hypothetical protein